MFSSTLQLWTGLTICPEPSGIYLVAVRLLCRFSICLEAQR